MKQQKIAAALFSAAFLLALVGILAVAILKPRSDFSYYENRDLASVPELSFSTMADGTYFTDWETALCDQAALRITALRAQTWVELNLLHKPVINGVVVTDEERLLPYVEYEAVDEEAIARQAETLAAGLENISETVEAYGGEYLYVAIPSAYSYSEDRYPFYLNNRSAYTQAETESFFGALDRHGVNYLDVDAAWKAEGSPAEYMSTVDHHYTWEGCFSAYQLVMERLNDLVGGGISALTQEDLEVIDLPNFYMGSYNRKLCGIWDGKETLRYAQLKDPIPFARYDWETGILGASTMVMLPETQEELVSYSMYMFGDISETIVQTEREELPSLLVYGDSFTNEMETILYASFDETRSLDFRSYNTMTLSEYIQFYQPDIVLCIRDYEQLLSAYGNGTTQ